MSTTICTEHANELVLVDDVLDAGGSAVVALGLINQDGSDTFPGRTLTPDQAEELAASLAQSAAAARAKAGRARTPLGGDQAHGDTLAAIRAAVPLTSTGPTLTDTSRPPQRIATPGGSGKRTSSGAGAAVRHGRAASEAQARELVQLPIADYDRLSALAITKQLSGLSAVQLSTLLAYEQSHRNRKTICDRIVALRSAAARTTNPMA
jgi:hypothetical protein